MKILHETLPNGLTILGEVNTAVESAAVAFMVRTGSRDESPVESGLSHFLEHMMFKGTKTRSSLDVTYALGNLAAQSNAYTSEENTVYYAVVLKEYFSAITELLCDMLRPSLDPVEFATEQKVILEEIALYQDKPHYFLYEKAIADFFGDHPAGKSVLGSTESVSALTPELMRGYFDRRYTPENILLIASGNFDWSAFCRDAAKYCGSWARGNATRNHPSFNPVVRSGEYKRKNVQQCHELLFARGPSATDPHRAALNVLSVILGDGGGSKLYWALVDKGIAESAHFEVDEKDGLGCLIASMSTAPKNVDKVSKILQEVLSQPLDFSEEDLQRAKAKILSRLVLGGELPMGRLSSIGYDWVYRGAKLSLRDHMEEYRKVTRTDIARGVAAYPLTNWSRYRLVPE